LKLGIAGVGLIGGSIGLRAVSLGWEVRGSDPGGANLRLAQQRGAIGGAAASLAELARWSDVLVLAAPLDATLAQLAELATLAAAPPWPAAVFDVASVKARVARAAGGVPGFVATHPIAGSEQSGPAAARADLFAERVWTYDAAAPPAAADRARAFIAAMGARPVPVENAEHDRIVALTSHLPQLASVALGAQLAPALSDGTVAALCGTGIQSMLRLAGSSWTVWRAILEANAAPVAREVRRLAATLGDLATALETGAAATLAPAFEQAQSAAAQLNESVAAHPPGVPAPNDKNQGTAPAV
jgi:prephenate dehydrogenase